MIEEAKGIPGFPNPDILENYHTQAEIVQIRRREAHEAMEKERENATAAIGKLLGKKIANITTKERENAARTLKLDVYDPRIATIGRTAPKKGRATTGQVNTPTTRGHSRQAGHGGGREDFSVPNLTRVDSPAGPARNTRSRSPKKRAADDQPAGQGLPKKKKTGENATIVEGVGRAM